MMLYIPEIFRYVGFYVAIALIAALVRLVHWCYVVYKKAKSFQRAQDDIKALTLQLSELRGYKCRYQESIMKYKDLFDELESTRKENQHLKSDITNRCVEYKKLLRELDAHRDTERELIKIKSCIRGQFYGLRVPISVTDEDSAHEYSIEIIKLTQYLSTCIMELGDYKSWDDFYKTELSKTVLCEYNLLAPRRVGRQKWGDGDGF